MMLMSLIAPFYMVNRYIEMNVKNIHRKMNKSKPGLYKLANSFAPICSGPHLGAVHCESAESVDA